jgi:hypothetical protein
MKFYRINKLDMKTRQNKNLIFFLSIGVIFIAAFGCGMLESVVGINKLYFCERYVSESDYCEGESDTFTLGSLTVMAKLKEPVGTDEVYINVKEKSSGQTINNYPFTVSSDMKYINFKGIAFTSAGSYTVSLTKKDGTEIVSSDIEITD